MKIRILGLLVALAVATPAYANPLDVVLEKIDSTNATLEDICYERTEGPREEGVPDVICAPFGQELRHLTGGG